MMYTVERSSRSGSHSAVAALPAAGPLASLKTSGKFVCHFGDNIPDEGWKRYLSSPEVFSFREEDKASYLA